jgi:hypothetical protein
MEINNIGEASTEAHEPHAEISSPAEAVESPDGAKNSRGGLQEADSPIAGEDAARQMDAALAQIDSSLPPQMSEGLRPEDIPGIIKNCFYAGASSYYYQKSDGDFIPLNTGFIAVRLERAILKLGYSKKQLGGLVEEAFMAIQEQHYVVANLEVAGFPKGLHTSPSGARILVQTEARLPKPEKSSWDALRSFLVALFGAAQLPYVFGILAVFARHLLAIRNDPARVWIRQPLPALAIAGPKGGGKSLFIAILKALFGERVAYPFEYLCGQTRFNSDVAAAEVLVVDDQMAAKDGPTRARLAAGIKQHLFSGSIRIEKKYAHAIQLEAHSILVFAMNEGPDALACLPTIDDSMQDKITLLKSNEVKFPGQPEAKDQYIQSLFAGVPGLLDYLLNEHKIEDRHRNHRTGIKAFQHEDLLQALDDISPETELLEILITVLLQTYLNKLPACGDQRVKVWSGKSFELHTLLEDSEKVSPLRLRQLLTSKNALGSRLWALHQIHPAMIRRGSVSNGRRNFEIHFSRHDIVNVMPELKAKLWGLEDEPAAED